MLIFYLLFVLVLTKSATSSYDKYASSKGWWGNIHHLVQLIGLSNKEEYKLIPMFSLIKCKLKSEKVALQNYLNAFSITNPQMRLKKLRNLHGILNSAKSSHTMLKIYLDKEKVNKVGSNEIFMSINSFLNIHHLNGIQITTGFQYETQVGGYLNFIQCLEIGMTALSRNMYYRAIEWTRVSSNQFSSSKSLNTGDIMLDLQSAMYAAAVQEHNRVFSKMRRNEYDPVDLYDIYSNLYTRPLVRFLKRTNHSNKSRSASWDIHYPRKMWGMFDKNGIVSRFTDLCNGKVLQSPGTIKNLNCYYNQYQHPYFHINPLKVEQLSENPPIFQFYELHGNKTIDYFKAFREVLINAQTLYGSDSHYKSFDDVGSTYARRYMQDNVYQNYPHFGTIMEYLTGLKIKNVAGPLLWAEYIYGRMVGVHTDTRGDNMETLEEMLTFLKKGELLAVLMHYIDTPNEGGETPFLQAGVRAPAIKGSAVLWMNSFKNGTTRKDVHHAGCPILHGNKIIMLTPILYRGNWKHYKCSLNPEE